MTDELNERGAIRNLLEEEPKLEVAARMTPPAVVIIVRYASGALAVPLTVTTARAVAATIVEYADDVERRSRDTN
ncbi:MAG: hypothetical protein M3O91_01460 [Chloroflexota bacterium]|nr:hypothetical protein [Chloroflexota bacterium]